MQTEKMLLTAEVDKADAWDNFESASRMHESLWRSGLTDEFHGNATLVNLPSEVLAEELENLANDYTGASREILGFVGGMFYAVSAHCRTRLSTVRENGLLLVILGGGEDLHPSGSCEQHLYFANSRLFLRIFPKKSAVSVQSGLVLVNRGNLTDVVSAGDRTLSAPERTALVRGLLDSFRPLVNKHTEFPI